VGSNPTASALFSGSVAALTAADPDHQPRDGTPKQMTTLANIARNLLSFQSLASGPFLNMPDGTRHEHPFS
jgi:hypothetical protein